MSLADDLILIVISKACVLSFKFCTVTLLLRAYTSSFQNFTARLTYADLLDGEVAD